jgi:hypothetical protein
MIAPYLTPVYKGHRKDTKHLNQLQTIFTYLQSNVATASMISEATGIPQKNICRYKRDLEKAGRLWETGKAPCKKTGFKAWYLTTDPSKAPLPTQLNLF